MKTCIAFSFLLVSAAAAAGAGKHTTIQFQERSELSSMADLQTRMRMNFAGAEDYDLPKERYRLYVPDGYDGKTAFGLIVYIDPDGSGNVKRHKGYADVLDKHNLIWIGADSAGNQRHVAHRVGLALDAIHNMPKQYKIDTDRIYVVGMSGGGRVASFVGLNFPDQVNGMFTFCGIDFYRNVPAPGQAGRFWRAKMNPPTNENLRKILHDNRHVLLTGEKDGNQPSTKAIHALMNKLHYKHAHYLEVPNMGHAWPPADWFEKGIILLDEPLKKND